MKTLFHSTNLRLVDKIPVYDTSDPKNYKVVLALAIPYAQKGDIVLVRAQQEVTNDIKETVEFKSYVVRTKANNEINGEYIVPKTTHSVPSALHHYIGNWIGMDEIPENGYYFYNLILWAKKDRQNPNEFLTVEGHGNLEVLIFRNDD